MYWCYVITLLSILFLLPTNAVWAVNYEVWLSDQVNSQGISADADTGTHGGIITIYDSADLEKQPPEHEPVNLEVTEIWPDALQNTGAELARIHGMLPSPNHNYMTANFVASGHLGIIDGRTKEAVALFRTTGTDTGQQNHMSFWSADGTHILVANQGGKLLERINITWDETGQDIIAAEFDADATLDLVGGTGRILAQPVADESLPTGSIQGTVMDGQSTLTPNNILKQDPKLRPNNTVICPIPSSNGQHVYVTLGGGGMFVVDYRATPMAIVAEYNQDRVHAAGCGGVEGGGFMYLNTGTSGPDISEFTVYRFPLNYRKAPQFHRPNRPRPVVIFEDPDNGQVIPGDNRDAHGIVFTPTRRYLHVFDRVRNNAEVFDVGTLQRFTYDLTTKNGRPNGESASVCGTSLGATTSNDPTPDLGDLSPNGDRIYVALRGPFPLSVAHAAEGSCPGLGIVELRDGGRRGILRHVLPTERLNHAGDKNLSDPHGAIVRIK